MKTLNIIEVMELPPGTEVWRTDTGVKYTVGLTLVSDYNVVLNLTIHSSRLEFVTEKPVVCFDFHTAINKLVAGGRVARKGWDQDSYMFINKDQQLLFSWRQHTVNAKTFTSPELTATDWYEHE